MSRALGLALARVVLPEYEGEDAGVEPEVDGQRQHEPLEGDPGDAAKGLRPDGGRVVVLGCSSMGIKDLG